MSPNIGFETIKRGEEDLQVANPDANPIEDLSNRKRKNDDEASPSQDDSNDKNAKSETPPDSNESKENTNESTQSSGNQRKGKQKTEKSESNKYSLEKSIRVPKVIALNKKDDFTRVNYPVREAIQEYISEFSKLSRISTSLILEYILEEYLLDSSIKKIESDIIELYKTVRFEENGVTEHLRKDLQLTIPKQYPPLISEMTSKFNDKYRLSLDKGNFVDILIQAMLDKTNKLK